MRFQSRLMEKRFCLRKMNLFPSTRRAMVTHADCEVFFDLVICRISLSRRLRPPGTILLAFRMSRKPWDDGPPKEIGQLPHCKWKASDVLLRFIATFNVGLSPPTVLWFCEEVKYVSPTSMPCLGLQVAWSGSNPESHVFFFVCINLTP